MSTPDFFRSRLDQMIDLRHPLAVLASRLPWVSIEAAVAPKVAHQAKPAKSVVGVDLAGEFEGEFGGGISPAGRPRLPMRLMVSLLYLKNNFNLSDEEPFGARPAAMPMPNNSSGCARRSSASARSSGW